MSDVDTPGTQPQPTGDFRGLITWRGVGDEHIEQTKLQISGARIKAYGRIIAAANASRPAFSASYDLLTDDSGITKRLSLHLVRESGDLHLTINRDSEGNWLIATPTSEVKDSFDGARDVDIALSPFFNSLPIRRLGLQQSTTEVAVPLVYVHLPDAAVVGESISYRPEPGGLRVDSPLASSSVTVDEYGIVVDYADLARRI